MDYVQVGNVNEELDDTLTELTKVSKRNSVLSKQNSQLQSKCNELDGDNASLQKSLEEIDQVYLSRWSR